MFKNVLLASIRLHCNLKSNWFQKPLKQKCKNLEIDSGFLLHMFAFITYKAIDNCGLENFVKFCTLNEETCGHN
jgi:hypothetical protein